MYLSMSALALSRQLPYTPFKCIVPHTICQHDSPRSSFSHCSICILKVCQASAQLLLKHYPIDFSIGFPIRSYNKYFSSPPSHSNSSNYSCSSNCFYSRFNSFSSSSTSIKYSSSISSYKSQFACFSRRSISEFPSSN